MTRGINTLTKKINKERKKEKLDERRRERMREGEVTAEYPFKATLIGSLKVSQCFTRSPNFSKQTSAYF